MTASSVDIFPCRVQLMGLPPSSSSSLVAANTFIRPPIAKIHGISRNLFGAPDPDEMKTLYQQEAERIRSYVLQRYNFDTKPLKPTNGEDHKNQLTSKTYSSQTTITTEMQPTSTEQDLTHDCHWRGERHCLKAFPESKQIEGPTSNKRNISKSSRRCTEFSSSLSPTVEHQKLHRRQSLLKESFNIRKTRVWMKKCDHHSNSETTSLKNSQNPHQNPEILKLSQHLKFQQGTCDVQDKGKKLLTSNSIISKQQTDIEGNSRTINSDGNYTTLSLQFIVSTQNAS